MIKKEIMKNSGLINEELDDSQKEKVKKAILTYISLFPASDGFSSEQIKAKIGVKYPSEDIEDVISDMIIDGLLKGKTYSFFLTDKGKSKVEIKKTNSQKRSAK